ncbi:MAG: hypothetical protein ACR2RB_10770 [Gammaproteobacteria bacterium]
MERQNTKSLVLRPEIDFHTIEQSLLDLNWQRMDNGTAQPPLVPGEPELATWVSADGTQRIVYSFNPVVKLRVLSFAGTDSQNACREITPRLPALQHADLTRLLASAEVRDILLGIFAGVELDAIDLLPQLDALRTHPDTHVANAAADAQHRLARRLTARGTEQLAREQANDPDRSVLFRRLGSVQEKRQILRWLARDHPRPNQEITKVLRTALSAQDWEIRVTAMLVTARLGATALTRDIARVALPKSSREGLNRNERGLLVALRKAALACLGGERPVSASASSRPPTDRQSMWDHLCRCVLGEPVQLDTASSMVRAFTEPLDLPEDPPEPPCEGAEKRGDFYYIVGTDIQLCWVARIPHLLGSADDAGSPDRLRLVSPATGFFVTKTPITRFQRAELWESGNDGAQQTESYWRVRWRTAVACVNALQDRLGANITLPTADQWEMAARGPDGRRRPWGNGLEAKWETKQSPWGVRELFCAGPEWVKKEHGPPTLAATDELRMCSNFATDADPATQAVVRLVLSCGN